MKKIMMKISTYLFVIYQLLIPMVQVAQAQEAMIQNELGGLIPDGTTGQTFDRAQNGTPIMNVDTPTSGGVSRNNFTDYNVNNENLILNNSKAVGISNLGGAILANPHLEYSNEARIILNEVTSTNTSTINGATEIFGKKADLVIANPNGIQVNSGSFINTATLTMITGSSNFEGDNLKDFDINRDASIEINGGTFGEKENVGLDLTQTDYSNIISRVVKISGDIYAKNLSIKTGNQKYDYATGEITSGTLPAKPIEYDENGEPIPADPEPILAVDASVFGSMYAGKISVVATEEGLGVKTDSSLVADLDNIEITSAGNIQYKDLQARNNIIIQSDENVFADVDASAIAGDNIDFNANEYLNSGQVYAINNVSLSGRKITNLAGNISTYSGDININANTFENLGVTDCDPATETCWTEEKINLNNPMRLNRYVHEYITQITSDFESNQSYLISGNNININTNNLKNISSIISASKNINIETNILENSNESLLGNAKNYYVKFWKATSGWCGCNHKNRYTRRAYDNFVPVYSNTPGIISGGDCVNITANEFIKNGISVEEGDVVSLTGAQTLIADVKANGFIPSYGFGEFSNNPMFDIAPANSQYLYETNSILINVDNLIGSEYFLSRAGLLGIDQELLTSKFLGDAFFEQDYVREQIVKLTGKPFLYEGSTDMNSEMQNLYNSSVDEAGRLGLEFGKELSQDQLDNLDKDIVWYIEREINGQKVLTPELYLSKSNRDKLNSFASARIYADDNVNLYANNIENSFGDIISYGELTLNADENIKNISGNIYGELAVSMNAGKNIEITTHKNIFNENISNLSELAYLGTSGDLNINAGEDIAVKASILSAENAEVNADGGVDIFSIKTNDRKYSSWKSGKTTYTLDKRYEYSEGSLLAINNDLNITSGDDINILASEIYTDGNVNLRAENQVNIMSEELTDSVMKTSKKNNTFSTTTTENYTENKRNIKSNIEGNNINIISGDDINIVGADLASVEDVAIQTGLKLDGTINENADLNIVGVKDSDYTFSYRKKEKFDLIGTMVSVYFSGGLNTDVMTKGNIHTKTTYDEMVLNNEIYAGQNLSLISANDMSILSSDLSSENIFDVTVGADLTVGNLNELHTSEETHEKFGGDLFAIATGSFIKKFGIVFDSDSIKNTADTIMEAKETTIHNEAHSVAIASNLESSNLMNLGSGNDVNIIGSNVSASNEVNVNTGGDFNLLAGQNTSETVDIYEDLSFDNLDANLDIARLSYSASVTQKVEKDVSKTSSITHTASNLESAGKININSDNAFVLGSNIAANDNIEINTQGDLTVQSVEDVYTTSTEHDKTYMTTTAKVGNAWVDAAYSAVDAAKSLEAVGDIDSEDAAFNATFAALQAVVEAGRIAKLAADIAKSATTAGTFGFYTSMSNTIGTESSFSNTTDIVNQASSIMSQGGDLSLNADSDMDIIGSDLIAYNGDINLSATDLTIESAQDKSISESGSKSYSMTTTFSSAGLDLPTWSESTSSSEETAITNVNSNVFAGNGAINITSRDDTVVAGAKVEAADVNIDVAGDLTVESRQDTVEMASKSQSISVGSTFSASLSKGSEHTAWTNEQTEIIGTNSVNIDVENNASLIGATVANRLEDGTDGNNLNFTADSLEVATLLDSNEESFLSASVGITTANQQKTINGREVDTANFGYANSEVDRKQETYATIGGGTISIGSGGQTGDNLNRDINETQLLTRDESSSIDIGLDFDLDGIGFEEMGNLGTNLSNAGSRVADSAYMLGDAVYDSFEKEKTILDVVDLYDDKIDRRVANEKFIASYPDLAVILNNSESVSLEDKQSAYLGYTQFMTGELGDKVFDGDVLMIAKSDGKAGAYNTESGDIKLNLNYTNLESESGINVLTHEYTHYLQGDEVDAKIAGDDASYLLNDALSFSGYDEIGSSDSVYYSRDDFSLLRENNFTTDFEDASKDDNLLCGGLCIAAGITLISSAVGGVTYYKTEDLEKSLLYAGGTAAGLATGGVLGLATAGVAGAAGFGTVGTIATGVVIEGAGMYAGGELAGYVGGDDLQNGFYIGDGIATVGALGKLGYEGYKAGKKFLSQTDEIYPEGSFSVIDWDGYPNSNPPSGPFKLLEGDDYIVARKAANKANANLRRSNQEFYSGKEIHEEIPVKFGGSSTNLNNKMTLTPEEHRKYTNFWNKLQKDIKGK